MAEVKSEDPENANKREKEEEESPIEQEGLTVKNTDDPTQPVWTFRMWFPGLLSCSLLSFLNQFFAYRTEPLFITQITVQVAMLPLGHVRDPRVRYEAILLQHEGTFHRYNACWNHQHWCGIEGSHWTCPSDRVFLDASVINRANTSLDIAQDIPQAVMDSLDQSSGPSGGNWNDATSNTTELQCLDYN
ncbi:Oligopeptide transporter 4 [Glycine soja]|uniref:Oligopeptide transporter 4 n=1 Tax=Glycine soja TaxID=3848 RepID=A0A445JAS4_GLYSO|nr:Oligopeptide transporter 4 [Glycine soja]